MDERRRGGEKGFGSLSTLLKISGELIIAGMGFALANPMPAAPSQIYFGLLNTVGSGLVFTWTEEAVTLPLLAPSR